MPHQPTTADALRATLISPNEADSNMEPANVVDGLFAIARSITGLADTIGRYAETHANRAASMTAAPIAPGLSEITEMILEGAAMKKRLISGTQARPPAR